MKKKRIILLVCALTLALTGCGRWGICGHEVDYWLRARHHAQEYGGYAENPSDSFGGYAESESGEGATYSGMIGDTMESCFFDFTVVSVRQAAARDGCAAHDGCIFLDAEIEVANTCGTELPMSIYDFQIQWGDFAADEFGYEAEPFWDGADTMPEQYTLAPDESRTMHAIYEVPESSLDSCYAVCYLEEFTDGTQGDLYGVLFTAAEMENDAAGESAADAA